LPFVELEWKIYEENYDDQIFAIHKQELEKASETGYTPDRHYPQLLVIQMKKQNNNDK
jgi:hypothetical protein